MKIRIVRTCGIAGQHVEAGTIVDVPKQEAIHLITIRRAVAFGEEQPVESAAPAVETRDPVVATETRKPGRKSSKLP